MGIFAKIRRHAAVAGGDFASMFKDVEIPLLPAAVTRLIAEINQPEHDIDGFTFGGRRPYTGWATLSGLARRS